MEVEDGGWRIEGGGWRMEDWRWRMEDGGLEDWRIGGGGWRMERILFLSSPAASNSFGAKTRDSFLPQWYNLVQYLANVVLGYYSALLG